jgi:hypothetical protein
MKIMRLIIGFGLIMAFAVFGFLFLQSLIGENIIAPISEPLLQFSTDMGLDPQINTAMNEAVAFYDNLGIKVDLLFLISWIAMEVLVLGLAVKMPKMPTFNFLTYLLFGTMILMFVLNFLTQATTWVTSNLINGIFDPSSTYLPIFNFYQNYQYIIVFLNFIAVLLINVVFSKKEQSSSVFDIGTGPQLNNIDNSQEVVEE